MTGNEENIERSVLGAVLISDTAMTSIADKLRSEMFHQYAHRDVYEAMMTVHLSGAQIDPYVVYQAMVKAGKKPVEGVLFLTGLSDDMGTAANVEIHAMLVIQKFMAREAVKIGHTIKMEAQDDTKDPLEVIGQAIMSLEALTGNISTGQKSYRQIVYDTIDRLKNPTNQDHMTGLPVYLHDFDRHTLGLQATDLIILAARPGMGKTAFAVQAAKRQAEHGAAIGIFSLEMSSKQLAERILCNELKVDIKTLRQGGLRPDQWQRLDSRTEQIAGLPLYLCDKGALSLTEMVAIAKKWKAKYDIAALYIDYLQLITLTTTKGMNKEQQVSTISARLKQLAKELNIPVVALSQLSRAVETRGGSHKPMLSDLRDSGAIEQDADMVLFLYRPEYYGLTHTEAGTDTRGLCEIGIAKYRNGETGDIDVSFEGAYFRFGNKEVYDAPEQPTGKLIPIHEAFEKDGYFNK